MEQKKYRFNPTSDVEVEALSPLQYFMGLDGYVVTGGTLPGSGFQPPGRGITLPVEIDGIPVTELRGTFKSDEISYIESCGLKRIDICIEGGSGFFSDGELRCEMPFICGNCYNTLEAVRIAFCAPKMRIKKFERAHMLTEVSFSGTVLDDADWDYGSFPREIFKDCKKLRKVNGVFEGYMLSGHTFDGCESLVSAPEFRVKRFSDYEFRGCRSLKNIYIPNTVTSFGTGVFSGCTQLEAIHLSDQVQEITPQMFEGCESLKKVFLADAITQIGAYAFCGCKDLHNPWVPENLTAIGAHAFEGCTGIYILKLPDSVETIGEDAFKDCANLTIKCSEGSVTHRYAEEHGIPYTLIWKEKEIQEQEYDLQKYVDAQKGNYALALQEIKNGKKREHWIWYIFPQVQGLGHSDNCHIYGIVSLAQAKAFLAHPYLGKNLREITGELLKLETDDIREVVGDPDDRKIRSSMTLFAEAAEGEDKALFLAVLDKFYDGRLDYRTLGILKNLS